MNIGKRLAKILVIMCMFVLNIVFLGEISAEIIADTDPGKVSDLAFVSQGTKMTGTSYIGEPYNGADASGGLYFDDLEGKENILCRQKGGKLRRFVNGGEIPKDATAIWSYFQGTPEDVGNKVDHTANNWSAYGWALDGLQQITYAEARQHYKYKVGKLSYSSGGSIPATPMQAYILAHAAENSNHNSHIAMAWWSSSIGPSDNGNNIVTVSYEGEPFTQQARKFEEFIRAAGSDVPSENGFNLREPKWVTENSYSKVTREYANNQYLIGPFCIDYVNKSYGNIVYGAMTDFVLYTDVNQKGIHLSDGGQNTWKILNNYDVKDSLKNYSFESNPNLNKNFPKGNQKFYIVINFESGQIDKKILQIKTKIKYMNGKGQYSQLTNDGFSYNEYMINGTWYGFLIVSQLSGYRAVDNMWFITYPVYQVDNANGGIAAAVRDTAHGGAYKDLGSYFGNLSYYGNYLGEWVHWVYKECSMQPGEFDTFLQRFGNQPIIDYVENNYSPASDEQRDEMVAKILDGTDSSARTAIFFEKYSKKAWLVEPGDMMANGRGLIGDPVFNRMALTAPPYDNRHTKLPVMFHDAEFPMDPHRSGYDYYRYGKTSDSDQMVEQWLEGTDLNTDDTGRLIGAAADIAAYNRQCAILLEYQESGTEPWQQLNAAISGSLWYQYYESNLLDCINDSQIQITKKMKGPNGEDVDVSIPFELTVTSTNTAKIYKDKKIIESGSSAPTKTISVNPKVTKASESEVYYWINTQASESSRNDSALKFKLVEKTNKLPDEYKNAKISRVIIRDSKGAIVYDSKTTRPSNNKYGISISNNNTIQGKMFQGVLSIEIENKIETPPVQGKINLYKKVVPSENDTSDSSRSTLVGKKFPFLVTIRPGEKGAFTYNGVTYLDEDVSVEDYRKVHPRENISDKHSCNIIVPVTALEKVEGGVAKTISVKWYKNSANPSYNVEEIKAESTGRTVELGAAINEYKEKIKGYIRDGAIAVSFDPSSETQLEEFAKNALSIINDDSELINGSGEFIEFDNNEDKIPKIIVTNTTKSYHGRLLIKKFLSVENIPDLSENEMDEYVRSLHLKFNFNGRIVYNKTASDKENTKDIRLSFGDEWAYKEYNSAKKLIGYVWEDYTDEICWEAGTQNPTYSITEEVDESGITKLLTDRTVTGTIDGKENTGGEAEATLVKYDNDAKWSFKNKLDFQDNNIKILKKILYNEAPEDKKDLLKQTFNFEVNIEGYFSYSKGGYSLPFGKHRLRLLENDSEELVEIDGTTELKYEDLVDSRKYVQLDFTSTTDDKDWSSGTIRFAKGDANVKVNISEIAVQGVNSTISGIPNISDWFSICSYKPGDITVTAINSVEEQFGKLRIKKEISGYDTLSAENKEKLNISFKVKAIAKKKEDNKWKLLKEKTINLDKENIDESGNLEWVDDEYIGWDPVIFERPIYYVQEIGSSLGNLIKFESISGAGRHIVINDNTSAYYSLFNMASTITFDSDVTDSLSVPIDETRMIFSNEQTIMGRVAAMGESEAVLFMDDSEFSSGRNSSENGKPVGKDYSDETNDIFCKNTVSSHSKSGYISIKKVITSDTIESNIYAFGIMITSGTFEYSADGTDENKKQFTITDKPLFLTNDRSLTEDNIEGSSDANKDRLPQVTVHKNAKTSETWKSGTFYWEGDPPTYEVINVEYVKAISDLGEVADKFEKVSDDIYYVINSSNSTSVAKGEGNLKGEIGSPNVSFTIENSTIPKKPVSFKISKTFSNTDEYFTREELERKKFTFLIDIDNSMEPTEAIAKFTSYSGDEGSSNGQYTYETDVIKLYVTTGVTEVKYCIKENYDDEGISFKRWYNLIINGESKAIEDETNKELTGTIETPVGVNASLSVTAENVHNPELDHGKLQIIKEWEGRGAEEIAKGKTVNIKAKINTDGVKNLKYVLPDKFISLDPNKDYYLTNTGISDSDTNRVVLKFDSDTSSLSETYTSGEFIWDKNGEIPTYEVSEVEKLPGVKEVIYVGENNPTGKADGNLAQSEDGTVKVKIINTVDIPDFVYLKIKKDIQSNASAYDGKTFRFRLNVQGYGDDIIDVVYKDGESSHKVISYPIYSGQNELSYTIEEIDMNGKSIHLVSLSDSKGNVADENTRILSGTLTRDDNDSNPLFITCVNSGEDIIPTKFDLKKYFTDSNGGLTPVNGTAGFEMKLHIPTDCYYLSNGENKDLIGGNDYYVSTDGKINTTKQTIYMGFNNSDEANWVSPEIFYPNGPELPTFEIREVFSDEDTRVTFSKDEYKITINGSSSPYSGSFSQSTQGIITLNATNRSIGWKEAKFNINKLVYEKKTRDNITEKYQKSVTGTVSFSLEIDTNSAGTTKYVLGGVETPMPAGKYYLNYDYSTGRETISNADTGIILDINGNSRSWDSDITIKWDEEGTSPTYNIKETGYNLNGETEGYITTIYNKNKEGNTGKLSDNTGGYIYITAENLYGDFNRAKIRIEKYFKNKTGSNKNFSGNVSFMMKINIPNEIDDCYYIDVDGNLTHLEKNNSYYMSSGPGVEISGSDANRVIIPFDNNNYELWESQGEIIWEIKSGYSPTYELYETDIVDTNGKSIRGNYSLEIPGAVNGRKTGLLSDTDPIEQAMTVTAINTDESIKGIQFKINKRFVQNYFGSEKDRTVKGNAYFSLKLEISDTVKNARYISADGTEKPLPTGTYYLMSDGSNEYLQSESENPNASQNRVVLSFDETSRSTWMSKGKIEWDFAQGDPVYTITEESISLEDGTTKDNYICSFEGTNTNTKTDIVYSSSPEGIVEINAKNTYRNIGTHLKIVKDFEVNKSDGTKGSYKVTGDVQFIASITIREGTSCTYNVEGLEPQILDEGTWYFNYDTTGERLEKDATSNRVKIHFSDIDSATWQSSGEIKWIEDKNIPRYTIEEATYTLEDGSTEADYSTSIDYSGSNRKNENISAVDKDGNATTKVKNTLNCGAFYINKKFVKKDEFNEENSYQVSGTVNYELKISVPNDDGVVKYVNGANSKILTVGDWYISNQGGTETISNDSNNRVSVTFDNNVDKSWNSAGSIVWTKNSSIPSYTITEKEANLTSIDGVTTEKDYITTIEGSNSNSLVGTVADIDKLNNKINVYIKNEYRKYTESAMVSLTKEFIKNEGGVNVHNTVYASVDFIVKITKTDKVKNLRYVVDGNTKYLNESNTWYFTNQGVDPVWDISTSMYVVNLNFINQSALTWNSKGELMWDADGEAPEYEYIERTSLDGVFDSVGVPNAENVMEYAQRNYTYIPQGASKGRLSEAINGKLSLNAKNAENGKISHIHLEKRLENDSTLTEEEKNDKVFEFKIKVENQIDGGKPIEHKFTLDKSPTEDVWSKDLTYFIPDGVESVPYTLYEINVPEDINYEYLHEENEDGTYSTEKTDIKDGLRGVLKPNDTSVPLKIHCLNKYVKDTKIRVQKVLDTNDLSESEKDDLVFWFVLNVEGYESKTFAMTHLQRTGDIFEREFEYDIPFGKEELSYSINEQGASTYNEFVEMYEEPRDETNPDKFITDITKSVKGKLSGLSNSVIRVVCKDRVSVNNVAHIHLKKILERTSNLSEEEKKDMVFTFRLTLDGESDSVDLALDRTQYEDGTNIWECDREITLPNGAVEEGYTLQEVNLPYDTVLYKIFEDGHEEEVTEGKALKGTLKKNTTEVPLHIVCKNNHATTTHIRLIKKVNNKDYMSEKDIKELKFKFELKATGLSSPIYIGLDYDQNYNESTGNWESSVFYLNIPADRSEIDYSVEEIDASSKVTFVKMYEDKDGGVHVEAPNKTISSTLSENTVDTTLNVICENNGSAKAYIRLEKYINKSVLEKGININDKIYRFRLIIDGYTSPIYVSLTQNNEANDPMDSHGLDGEFYYWKRTLEFNIPSNKDGINYEVQESELPEDIVFEKMYIEGEEGEIHNIKDTIKGTLRANRIDTPAIVHCENGREISQSLAIKIDKVLDNSGGIWSIDQIERAEFAFNLSVEGYGENVRITLDKRDIDESTISSNEVRWSRTLDGYEILSGHTGLNYSIKEVSVPEGMVFVKLEDGKGNSIDNIEDELNGEFKVNDGNQLTLTCKNEVENSEEKIAHLKILKTVDSGVSLNEGTVFIFSLYIKGDHTEYTQSVEVSKHTTSEGIVSWESNVIDIQIPPTEERLYYSVNEINTSGTVFASISNNTGFIDRNDPDVEREPIIVRAVNDSPGGFPGYANLKIRKIGKVDPKVKYTFKLRVNANNKVTYYIDKYRNGEIEANQSKEFIIENVTLGITKNVGRFDWNGRNKDGPTYTIEEIIDENGNVIKGESVSASGKLDRNTVKVAIQKNISKKNYGYIKVTKKLTGDEADLAENIGKEYHFNVDVYESRTSDKLLKSFSNQIIKANETWTSGKIEWNSFDEEPYFKIEEIDEKNYTIEVDNNSYGKNTRFKVNALKKEDGEETLEVTPDSKDTTEVAIVNNVTKKPNKTNIELEKVCVSDKSGIPDDVTFNVRVDITSDTYFSYDEDGDGTSLLYKNYTRKYKVRVTNADPDRPGRMNTEWSWKVGGRTYTKNGNAILEGIEWYDGNGTSKAPVVTVTESQHSQESNGWWVIDGISNKQYTLSNGVTVKSTINNRFSLGASQELLMDIGGYAWIDNPSGDKGSDTEDGIRDIGGRDNPYQNVEVYVRRMSNNELLQLYDINGGLVEQPIHTDAAGEWSAKVQLAHLGDLKKNEFYVQFVYDGQTYEPTKSLIPKTNSSGYRANANDYYKAAKSDNIADKETYIDSSHAIDIANTYSNKVQYNSSRDQFNAKFSNIIGDKVIDGMGKTIGKAIGEGGEYELEYTSNANDVYARTVDAETGEVKSMKQIDRVTSTLVTTNVDGTIKEQYKMSATTKELGLSFPVDDTVILLNKNSTKGSSKYIAAYPYARNINLGVRYRAETDISAEKVLREANVITNGRKLTYKYGQSFATMGVTTSEEANTLHYKLGLFKTDYYYRVDLYKKNKDYDDLYKFYENMENGIYSSEMDVYLTYNITLTNNSTDSKVKINAIDDYSSNSLIPVTKDIYKILDDSDGTTKIENKKTEETKIFDKASETYNSLNKNTASVSAPVDVISSNGTTYNKRTYVIKNPGEIDIGKNVTYSITYKVDKGNSDGVRDAIRLGKQDNIVEINSYSTYKNRKINGKIDKNSAPSNVNIGSFDTYTRFENDTYKAVLDMYLDNESTEKTISGLAFEDKKIDDDSVGDGVYNNDKNDNEAVIGGLTTELVEKVQLKKSKTESVEFDYLWDTNTNLASLGGKTFEELTGFRSTVETARTKIERKVGDKLGDDGNVAGVVSSLETQEVGTYRFENIPSGNYVVRARYGNDKNSQQNTRDISGEPAAYNTKEKLENNTSTKTTYDLALGKYVTYTYTPYKKYDLKTGSNVANYDEIKYGKTTTIYNGQDFKATLYGGSLTEEFIGNTETGSNANKSYVRDNEYRRAEVMANSETITNKNGGDMSEANDVSGAYGVLHEKYDMYADTPKIKILNYKDDEIDGLYTTSKKKKGTIANKQNVKNVNIGLIERPENKIVLDDEVSSIKLITNDNKVLFNAEYDINYKKVKGKPSDDIPVVAKLDSDNYLVVIVELNKNKSTGIELMQAIGKTENKLEQLKEKNKGIQNFKFINIDEDLLQGLYIAIGYKITAINVGEVDYTTKAISEISGSKSPIGEYATIINAAKTVNDNNSIYSISGSRVDGKKDLKFGSVIGNYYYTGSIAGQAIVTTRVRQVLDYVDTDAVFDTSENSNYNRYWKNTSIEELNGNGNYEKRLIGKTVANGKTIIDKNNRQYTSDTQNNLALSVDQLNDNYRPWSDDKGAVTNGAFEFRLVPIRAYGNNIFHENMLYLDKDLNGGTEDIIIGKNPNTDEKVKTSGTIDIITTKKISTLSSDESNSLAFDALAEIVKYENTVGRRDMTYITGVITPKYGEFFESLKKRGASSTEIVTFTPPTGIDKSNILLTQVLAIASVSIVIIAGGIILIRKKVLDSKFIK